MQHLNLYLDQMAPGAELDLGAAGVRAVYVWDGTVRVAADRLAASLAANSAISVPGPARAHAGADGARLLRFEVAAEQTGAAGLLRSDRLALPADHQDGWLLRCDRVDFPADGEALLHTHQGPGARCLIMGRFTVETNGQIHRISPGEAWYEAGPDPVYAKAGSDPAAFVRVMILPDRLKGQSSIRYVNEADLAKPKSQSYQVFLDQPIDLGGGRG